MPPGFHMGHSFSLTATPALEVGGGRQPDRALNQSQIVTSWLLIESESRTKLFPLGCIHKRRIEPLLEKRPVVSLLRVGGKRNKGPQ